MRPTCNCGGPLADQATVCHTCTRRLEQYFAEVPAWVDDLETSLAGIRSPRSGGTTAGTGFMVDLAAGEVLRELVNTLAAACVDAQPLFRRQHPHPRNPKIASAWLLAVVRGIRTQEYAPGLLRGLDGLHARTYGSRYDSKQRGIVDNTPARVYLGACDVESCTGEVFAEEDEWLGQCLVCETGYPVAEKRALIEAALDDKLCTVDELGGMAVILGITTDRTRVEKAVLRWQRKGRITGTSDGRFRYREARPLLYLEFAQKGAYT